MFTIFTAFKFVVVPFFTVEEAAQRQKQMKARKPDRQPYCQWYYYFCMWYFDDKDAELDWVKHIRLDANESNCMWIIYTNILKRHAYYNNFLCLDWM